MRRGGRPGGLVTHVARGSARNKSHLDGGYPRVSAGGVAGLCNEVRFPTGIGAAPAPGQRLAITLRAARWVRHARGAWLGA
jgi:hypothetical protein